MSSVWGLQPTAGGDSQSTSAAEPEAPLVSLAARTSEMTAAESEGIAFDPSFITTHCLVFDSCCFCFLPQLVVLSFLQGSLLSNAELSVKLSSE